MNARLPEANRIYTADAIQLLATWPRHSFDALVTDPPYGNATGYGSAKRRIIGDEHPLVGLQGLAACYRVLKPNSAAFVFTSAQHVGFLEHFVRRYTRFTPKELLVWDKGSPGFGSVYRRAHENILVLHKGVPRYRARVISTVIGEPRADTRLHPHAKPVPLLERLIGLTTEPGDLVLDPFCGIGSTGVAAVNTGRCIVGVEIDATYASIARARVAEALDRAPPEAA
jgi:DNA modification methylase